MQTSPLTPDLQDVWLYYIFCMSYFDLCIVIAFANGGLGVVLHMSSSTSNRLLSFINLIFFIIIIICVQHSPFIFKAYSKINYILLTTFFLCYLQT
jgi:hypothetical protein